ncbi:MAG: isoprenylcysteine carboxylmethyltransferase family protein [Schleiferiaceae bacterium]|jgi:protein-S-isoprenylcysteine O-methyltransferase Ste14|nr:isoprenylcysteine carboxylmethyltransferase family protein [Schleiferiaceae bacterium]
MKKLIESVVVILLAVVLPLAGRLEWVLTWPAIAVAVIGMVMIYTQPPVPNLDEIEEHDADDKKTALLLLSSSIIGYQLALIDAAYISDKLPSAQDVSSWLGLGIMIFSMIYRWQVIKYLGRHFTAQVTILKDHKLITTGPYKSLRHPSYTAAFLTFTGISVLFGSMLSFIYLLVVILPIQAYRIRLEEKALLDTFGEEYRVYQSKTKKMFPYLW